MKAWGWGLLVWALAAVPAAASQLPGVDLEGGHGRLTVGVGAVAADYAPFDRWSVGAMMSVVPLTFESGAVTFGHVGARVGYRAWELGGWSVGVLVSGGMTEANRYGDYLPSSRRYAGWVQPALSGAASWPVGDSGMRLHVRGTLGPSFTFDPNQAGVYVFPLLPNAEVALAFPTRQRMGQVPGMATVAMTESAHEVVIGGGSIIAYRWKP